MILKWTSLDTLLTAGLEALTVDHYEESEGDALPYGPDWPGLRLAERQGILQCLGAWIDSELIGYAWIIVAPTLHSPALVAMVNAIYIAPAHRGRGVALIRHVERHLKAQGIVKFGIGAKTAKSVGRRRPAQLGDLLARMGYVEEEITFAKML